MAEPVPQPVRSPAPRRRRLILAAGACAVLLLLTFAAEAYLQFFPPSDLHPYLGDASPLTGQFVAHPDFGYTYRDYSVFEESYRARLAELGPLQNPKPTWALFGNSFFQARGMLGDMLTAALPDHRIFYLKRNELLELRLAQIELLLEQGLRPKRILIELMPVDVTQLAQQPLSSIRINPHGAIVYDVHLPPAPFAWLIQHSRVALTAWVRCGLHAHYGRSAARSLQEHIHDDLRADLARLFGAVGRLSRQYDIQTTLVLIPAHEQVVRNEGFYFQSIIAPIARDAGLDVFDPHDAFMAQQDKPSLYIPDKHLSDRGNTLLMRELFQHFGMQPPGNPQEAQP